MCGGFVRLHCWRRRFGPPYGICFRATTPLLRDVVVAGRIERHFSGLGDHLSSTIEFLRQREDDPLAGSAELRRAAVAPTDAEIAPLDRVRRLIAVRRGEPWWSHALSV